MTVYIFADEKKLAGKTNIMKDQAVSGTAET